VRCTVRCFLGMTDVAVSKLGMECNAMQSNQLKSNQKGLVGLIGIKGARSGFKS
jgi:hypothetical protein